MRALRVSCLIGGHLKHNSMKCFWRRNCGGRRKACVVVLLSVMIAVIEMRHQGTRKLRVVGHEDWRIYVGDVVEQVVERLKCVSRWVVCSILICLQVPSAFSVGVGEAFNVEEAKRMEGIEYEVAPPAWIVGGLIGSEPSRLSQIGNREISCCRRGLRRGYGCSQSSTVRPTTRRNSRVLFEARINPALSA